MKETFKSAFWVDSPERAEEILNDIRSLHSTKKGWREIDAYIETRSIKKKWGIAKQYRAVRVHEHLK